MHASPGCFMTEFATTPSLSLRPIFGGSESNHVAEEKRRDELVRQTKVTHGMTSMMSKESPSKSLGSMVSWVGDARDVMHNNDATMLLLLNSKVLNVDVLGIGSQLALVSTPVGHILNLLPKLVMDARLGWHCLIIILVPTMFRTKLLRLSGPYML